jgi:NAD(P)-dependent dehydrogenase (short-subunit alcohol dehydrogenase family)
MTNERSVALVTGANTGIGFEAAVALAKKGFHVVLGCRDKARGEEALRLVRERSAGSAELLLVDLSSQESIRRAAAESLRLHPRLKVLLNNAGLVTRTRQTTREGVETTLGVNHLGHFLLTQLLLPSLQAGAPSRIVNVSSDAHRGAKWDWDDPQIERGWGTLRAYANSKLANVWFTRELSRRLPAGVTATAVHPGAIATDIWRSAPKLARVFLNWVLPSAEKGSRPLVRLAADGDVEGLSGRYFDRLKEREPSKAGQDDASAGRLWELSERLTR